MKDVTMTKQLRTVVCCLWLHDTVYNTCIQQFPGKGSVRGNRRRVSSYLQIMVTNVLKTKALL